jgi:hypothetical protein
MFYVTGNMVLIKKEGRFCKYNNVKLEIPSDIEILTCDNCEEEYTDEKTDLLIDSALKIIYLSLNK